MQHEVLSDRVKAAYADKKFELHEKLMYEWEQSRDNLISMVSQITSDPIEPKALKETEAPDMFLYWDLKRFVESNSAKDTWYSESFQAYVEDLYKSLYEGYLLPRIELPAFSTRSRRTEVFEPMPANWVEYLVFNKDESALSQMKAVINVRAETGQAETRAFISANVGGRIYSFELNYPKLKDSIWSFSNFVKTQDSFNKTEWTCEFKNKEECNG